MIRALNIALNAAHPELPLPEAVVFESSPTALFIHGVPRRVGKWALTAVRVAMTRPDGSVATRSAVESAGGVWTVTLPGSPAAGRTAAGLRIYADGVDETGAAVTGYVLGFADLSVRTLSAAPVPEPGASSHEMWFFESCPENPRAGYVYAETDGTLMLYDGSAWVDFGGGGTTDYNDLENKPRINGVTLAGDKTAAELGLATSAQGAKADTAYQKPQAGIPASDMTQAVQTSLGKADTALQIAPVTSVNGKTGAVVLTANDIGALSNQGGSIGDGMIRAGLPSDEDEYAELASDGITLYNYTGGRWVVTYYGPFAVNIDGAILTFQRKSGTLALLSDIPSVAGFAPLDSPAFTGTPTAPTPATNDNSTNVATTAFVMTAISGISVTPLAGRNFDFATTQGVMDALKATIETLGGTVTNAPTTPAQNNQTQGE